MFDNNLGDVFETLETKIGYSFADRNLLRQALTHKSHHHENLEHSPGDNERLEFLGDAVLSLVLSEILLREFPRENEGALSRRRANLVNEASLAEIARDLGLESFLLLGRGEVHSGGAAKPRLQAAVLESVIGAVYLDGGYEASGSLVRTLFAGRLEGLPEQPAVDAKTQLQAAVQEHFRSTPYYRLTGSDGPDHDKEFAVSVWIGERMVASGQGKTKKGAEQDAAGKALQEWEKICER